MKILVCAGWYYPVKNPRAFRVTELVREMVAQGDEVELFVPEGSVVEEEIRENCHFVPCTYFNTGVSSASTAVKVSLLPIKKAWRILFLEGPRMALYAWHLFWELYKNRERLEKSELEIAVSFPFFVLVGVRIANLFRKSIGVRIADCGDPFYNNPAHRNALHLKWVEHWVLAGFHHITIPIEEARRAYTDIVQADKLKVIPQGVRRIDIPDGVYQPRAIPTFCYAGVFYKEIRDPSYFFDWLVGVDSPFVFVVYALPDVFTGELLDKYKAILGDKLCVHAPIAREELFYELATMDFVINFDNEDSAQKPSKLIDYAMSKRPILSFNRKTFKEEDFIDFLNGQYKAQVHIDIADYDIRNIVAKFKALCN